MFLAIIIYLLAALYVFMEYYMDPMSPYKWPVALFMGLIWLPYLLLGLVMLAIAKIGQLFYGE